MSASQRRKGAVAERDLARRLAAVFPDARRRCAGEESQDEHRGRDVDGTGPFCVQACHAHRPPIYQKLAEAERAATVNEIPVAFTKRTGGVWLATLRLDDWLELARGYMGELQALEDADADEQELRYLASLRYGIDGAGWRLVVSGDPAQGWRAEVRRDPGDAILARAEATTLTHVVVLAFVGAIASLLATPPKLGPAPKAA